MKFLEDKRIFLIDSFLYIYKYYYYYKKFYEKKKSILIGFFNFIINILIKKKPTYIIAVFDGKIKRNKKRLFYNNYKINRKKIDINIEEVLNIIFNNLKKLNIQYVYKKNLEADEIIGSLKKKYENLGYNNYIYTDDKDYYQLITNKTFIINKKKTINKNFILKKYKLKKIKQYIDYISLIGDKSDNIPGIPKVGKKTANILLDKYKNIEDIYKYINDINNKIKLKIKYYKYVALLYKKIVKININIDIDIKLLPRIKIKKQKIFNILLNIHRYFFLKRLKKINIIN
ncbi:MAG: hypothetical protein NHG13_00520 [Candidatus Shikimatogenerans bostrichidophilus]|nr:MAG: hypothetical protein NHG13_00520 [Candidatus Shikimatogenerans bostrichidophilus]